MARYLVERTFPEGLALLLTPQGNEVTQTVVRKNAENGVTWIHSCVTTDKKHTFCICDGPSPEAIRRAAEKNGLPVDRNSEIRVLDPYFHHCSSTRPEAAGGSRILRHAARPLLRRGSTSHSPRAYRNR